MKKFILLLVFVQLVVSGCGNPPQDKFIGQWKYSNSGKLMTVPLKCTITMEISRGQHSHEYILNYLKFDLSPAVFGMSGGEFFNHVVLKIQNDDTMVTPLLSSGTDMQIVLKDTNQIELNPNPCSGIAPNGLLNKVK